MKKSPHQEKMKIPYDDFSTQGKIFGISGSPRRNGNSDILLHEIIKGATTSGVAAESLNLTRCKFKGCIGCEKCRKDKICTGLNDDMTSIYEKVVHSQGLVLVCPTHNYNITSWMKAFIDRLYCFYTFENDRPRSWSSLLAGQQRKAVLAAICEQENIRDMGFTLEAMAEPLKALGYEIVGQLAVFKIFDKGGVKKETQYLQEAYKLGVQLAEEIRP